MQVAIVGASSNPERYSYKALRMLQKFHHNVVLVSPNLSEIENIPCYHSIAEIPAKIKIHTVTLYVNSSKSDGMEKDLITLAPNRVIFNPGAENPPLKKVLESHGVDCLEACTLVLLSTHQF